MPRAIMLSANMHLRGLEENNPYTMYGHYTWLQSFVNYAKDTYDVKSYERILRKYHLGTGLRIMRVKD